MYTRVSLPAGRGEARGELPGRLRRLQRVHKVGELLGLFQK